MPKKTPTKAVSPDLTDEEKTPESVKQVETGFEYFFPRHQKTIVAGSLAEAQTALEKEIANDAK